jgi:hypothetical protein
VLDIHRKEAVGLITSFHLSIHFILLVSSLLPAVALHTVDSTDTDTGVDTMSAEKIYHSPYPDVKLPETSCWHFVFDKPNPPKDKVIYVDGLTNRQIKSVDYTLCLDIIILISFHC